MTGPEALKPEGETVSQALDRAEWRPANLPTEAYELKLDGWTLATIEQRNRYCDRGHWQALVECVPNLDAYDGFPRYYMRLEVAKQEVLDFLRWRLCKVRAEHCPPTLLDAMLGEREAATVCSADELAKARAPCTVKPKFPFVYREQGQHAFEFDERRNVHVCPCGAAVPDREP